ncbi:hypothetical protein VSS74_31435, partial [Conexibacter stalactiti]|nr:hypothetical protein [Conexibacter stalactiti]MEC5039556.1 hypothetical protein [Conexibacter stalactiti]
MPERAGALLRRALAEPPEPALRATVLRELGATELTLLDGAAAAHLGEALAAERDPAQRAEIAVELGFAHYTAGSHGDAVDVLLATIEEVESDPRLREQRLRLEGVLALAGRYDLRTETRVRGRVARLAAGLAGETPGERLVRAVAASESPGETAAELARATELAAWSLDAPRPWPDPTAGVGEAAMFLHAGRPAAAAEVVERIVAQAAREGSQIRYAMGLATRGVVALDVGDLRTAEAELATALDALAEARAERMARTTVAFHAMALAERGALDRAEAALEQHGLTGAVPEQMLFNPLLFMRGQLRLAQRRAVEAEADFRELGRRHERWEMTRPSPPWRSACALALIAQGEPAQARVLAAAELPLARRWDTPKAIAYTTRALALADADGDGDARIDGLTAAVALLDGTPWRLDRARARVDLGGALRRAGQRRAAREALALA